MIAQAFTELSFVHLVFFLFAVLCVCGFEFVNGFHDTANAVATVIYTRSLRPVVAVVWSGICNFFGVWFGGIAVALGIIKLLPVGEMMAMTQGENFAIVFAILFAAIIWNLYTWYFGIPCSSSHTLIGSILGAGMGFYLVHGGKGINWSKASDIGMSLLLSPAFGFMMAIMLLFLFRFLIRNKAIFKDPSQNENRPPPPWIRGILLLTCTLVSFFHGSNDGQKGVGIMMIVLLAMMPGYYALNPQQSPEQIQHAISRMQNAAAPFIQTSMATDYTKDLATLNDLSNESGSIDQADKDQKLAFRKRIQTFSGQAKKMLEDPAFLPAPEKRAEFKAGLKTLSASTDFAPVEAIMLISLSLGLGTMVGWKRIVITIGEKIGKSHLTYAQGAAAELVAAGTIGMSSGLGLPVSTTHVLSSGIAGSMVAMGGARNLQRKTVTTIALAWILTLPVTFGGGFLFYFIFHWLF